MTTSDHTYPYPDCTCGLPWGIHEIVESKREGRRRGKATGTVDGRLVECHGYTPVVTP